MLSSTRNGKRGIDGLVNAKAPTRREKPKDTTRWSVSKIDLKPRFDVECDLRVVLHEQIVQLVLALSCKDRRVQSVFLL